MPGEPPVMLVSVALMAAEPLTRNDSDEPLAVRVSVVPAASGAVGAEEPSCVQLPLARLNSMSRGLPLFHQYSPRYRFWPPFWARTAGPIHWPPLSWVAVTEICGTGRSSRSPGCGCHPS